MAGLKRRRLRMPVMWVDVVVDLLCGSFCGMLSVKEVGRDV